MIIDAHMHLWKKIRGLTDPHTSVKPLKNGMIAIGGRPLLGMPATMLDCAARAELAVAEFDAAGVDAGVVVQESMDGPQNDYLLEVQRKFPGRFFMHALPDIFRPDTIARQAATLFKRGFGGLKLPAGRMAGLIELDDPRLMAVWDRMAAEDHVLAVDLAEGAAQVPAMERILKRHPKLRVAIGHFGLVTRGGANQWLHQIRLARHENVYIEGGGIIWLFRHEGYPFPGAVRAVRRAMQEVGVEKLMWGSDWPRTMVDFTYRQSLDFLRLDKSFTDRQKKLLLGENAARLYRLARPRISRAPAGLITSG